MNNLSMAYEEALSKLKQESGAQTEQIVRSVLEVKNGLAEFEAVVDELEIKRKDKAQLVALMVEQSSDLVAIMCSLLGKRFKTEVMPLVEQVIEDAKRSRHMQ